jgi:hypothetical protein
MGGSQTGDLPVVQAGVQKHEANMDTKGACLYPIALDASRCCSTAAIALAYIVSFSCEMDFLTRNASA